MNLEESLKKVQSASLKLALLDDRLISDILLRLADNLEDSTSDILEANAKDLAVLSNDDPVKDRVLLTEQRIYDIAESVRDIASYPSPVGQSIEQRTLDNGLDLKKISTPLGVVGAIFEARPNVVIDIFALCFKSKNASVMKGGSKSAHSNTAMSSVIIDTLDEMRGDHLDLIDSHVLLPNDKELVADFLKADEYVDVIVPRGGKDLIDFVRKNSLIPVIETGAGVVHTYFDESGDINKGVGVIFNAKTSRPGVCNALDTLIIHRSRLSDLPELCEKLRDFRVEIFADEYSFDAINGEYPHDLLKHATEESFGVEYLSLKMSIKTVANLDEAIDHINTFGSGHSEAIITESPENADRFLKAVDAAAVYVNASTRFTDGGVFGLGAEVGISTQKLHARGPMGIKELTSYKWQIKGDGQVR